VEQTGHPLCREAGEGQTVPAEGLRLISLAEKGLFLSMVPIAPSSQTRNGNPHPCPGSGT
jgi:hypothetical protein